MRVNELGRIQKVNAEGTRGIRVTLTDSGSGLYTLTASEYGIDGIFETHRFSYSAGAGDPLATLRLRIGSRSSAKGRALALSILRGLEDWTLASVVPPAGALVAVFFPSRAPWTLLALTGGVDASVTPR